MSSINKNVSNLNTYAQVTKNVYKKRITKDRVEDINNNQKAEESTIRETLTLILQKLKKQNKKINKLCSEVAEIRNENKEPKGTYLFKTK